MRIITIIATATVCAPHVFCDVINMDISSDEIVVSTCYMYGALLRHAVMFSSTFPDASPSHVLVIYHNRPSILLYLVAACRLTFPSTLVTPEPCAGSTPKPSRQLGVIYDIS